VYLRYLLDLCGSPLKADLKTAWLSALRMGLYIEGEPERLRSDSGFNALGVLCDLVDHEGWSDFGYCGYAFMPPVEVLAQVGLSLDHAEDVIDSCSFEAASLYIEENL
jgi:hypothetical protein